MLYDKSLDTMVRVRLLNVLAVAALKDDVILLLHQDRREHTMMNYAFDIDRHPHDEQLSLSLFVSKNIKNKHPTIIVEIKFVFLFSFFFS